MNNRWLILIFVSNFVVGSQGQCYLSNWTLSMRKEGYSECEQPNTFIRGFARGKRASDSSDGLQLITQAQCCPSPQMWQESKAETVSEDWKKSLDKDKRWAFCRSGYFLQALYRSASSYGWLSNLDAARCARPIGHPLYYGECYEENINCCFNKAGLCRCRRHYFVVAIYRGDCDRLFCLDRLRCCMMSENHEQTY